MSLQQDQASVAFVSQHAAVREALEQAIPRLREMLGEQELQLVQVDVSQREAHQDGGQGGLGQDANGEARSDGPASAEADAVEVDDAGPMTQSRGLVDLFA